MCNFKTTVYGASFTTDTGIFHKKRYILTEAFTPSTAKRTYLNKTFTAYNMRECRFSLALIFQYKNRIVDTES